MWSWGVWESNSTAPSIVVVPELLTTIFMPPPAETESLEEGCRGDQEAQADGHERLLRVLTGEHGGTRVLTGEHGGTGEQAEGTPAVAFRGLGP